MPMYVIYDRETGDVIHTHLSRGPMDLDEDVIEDLIASERLDRAAFVAAAPDALRDSAAFGRTVAIRSLRIAGPEASDGGIDPAAGYRQAV